MWPCNCYQESLLGSVVIIPSIQMGDQQLVCKLHPRVSIILQLLIASPSSECLPMLINKLESEKVCMKGPTSDLEHPHLSNANA